MHDSTFTVASATANPARELPALRTAQAQILHNASQRVELSKAAHPRE